MGNWYRTCALIFLLPNRFFRFNRVKRSMGRRQSFYHSTTELIREVLLHKCVFRYSQGSCASVWEKLCSIFFKLIKCASSPVDISLSLSLSLSLSHFSLSLSFLLWSAFSLSSLWVSLLFSLYACSLLDPTNGPYAPGLVRCVFSTKDMAYHAYGQNWSMILVPGHDRVPHHKVYTLAPH